MTGTVLVLILLGFYVILLIRLTPAFDDLVKSAGGFVGRLIGIFFLLYVLLAGGYLLALLRYLVPASLITGVSGRWIAFWAIVACSLGTYKGMQRRGRMAEVSGGLLLGGIVIMLALCVPQAKAEYFMEALQWNEVTGKNIRQSFYGILCAFSAVALLPFLMGDVEKYGSAGKTAAGAILTLGVLLIGMELLLPAVLGYDRIKAESYPVLPLLDGADLPGNVLARFDIIWMGFLLYSLLFCDRKFAALWTSDHPKSTPWYGAVMDAGDDISDITSGREWKWNLKLFWVDSGICFCSGNFNLPGLSVFQRKGET